MTNPCSSRASPLIGLIVFGGVATGLAALASASSLSEQNIASSASLQPSAGRHQSRADLQGLIELPNVKEVTPHIETVLPAPPTRSSFMATWVSVSDAKGYLLDVSMSNSFKSYLDDYHDLDIGDTNGRAVTGLNPGTTYFYRVRPYTAIGLGSYSDVMTATTEAPTGLIIHATFDSSITGNPNAAAIEAMINRAIGIYESLFSDPFTAQIYFRYATTWPDGNPLPQGLISASNWVYYGLPWSTFISALRADARTANDNIANASLPGSTLSTNINPASANGRAIGLDTPTAMFADGTVGPGGPYDGIVTLKSTVAWQFTRPVSAGNFDAQRLTEHEINEVLGFGSFLTLGGTDLRPQDLFSWSSPGVRNLTSNGSRYFSINGGSTNIVSFNQDSAGDFGDWLSEACPQTHPYVQNAFNCTGQSSDISTTSPEGINLDIIGYDLAITPTATPTPMPTATPVPTPEACYANFTTAEGCNALGSLTTGVGNTALGWRSLFLDTTGSFNTGVGAGALALNTGSSNTAVGAAALLLNTTGSNNTALGTDALVFNDSGSSNTATGYFALMNNTTGGSNTGIGGEALTANTSGNSNTAIGNMALMNSQTTSDNVCVGSEAGSGITTADNNIIIGHHPGVHTVFGQESDRCYIDNIYNRPVSVATAMTVIVDSDGRLGTVTVDGSHPSGSSPKGIRPQAIPDAASQAMLDLKLQSMRATVAQQQNQIKVLTAQVKENTEQIQKANARLEMNKPVLKVVANKRKAVP